MSDLLIECPCTTIEQDEDCPVGFPSLLCGACKGTGRTPEATVTALAAEMLRIASDMGEPEDPFAAWETIDLIKSQHGQLLKALTDILSNHETAGAGASIFQCTTQQVVAARAAVARATIGAGSSSASHATVPATNKGHSHD